MSSHSHPSHRASLVLLFPATALAAFGLGLLALAATTPAPDLTDLPLPGSRAAQVPDQTATSDPAPEVATQWAALFGTPTPEPVIAPPEPTPEPEPAAPDVIEYDPDIYVLRGLVYQESGGWALLETDDGSMVIRRGDILPGGEVVAFIDEEGVEIEVDGEIYFISFDEDMDGPAGGLLDFVVENPERFEASPPTNRGAIRFNDPFVGRSEPSPSTLFGIGDVGR
ncbi:hypothetical protein [Pararhodobacter sp.]|uniref:hypothetical protein n=1 Tax=Pararhodobacter sp. TaxID=2127056 RepID=UPI002AFF354A|nr:hypothetical protein [Pararhodobacter sp.]